MNMMAIFIFSILLLATVVVEYKLAFASSLEVKNNRLRIHTWWIIFSICLPIFYISGWAITLLVYGLVYWAAFELVKLTRFRIELTSIFVFSVVLVTYHSLILRFYELQLLFLVIPIILSLIWFSVFKRIPKLSGGQALLVLLLGLTSILTIDLIRLMAEDMNIDAGLVILLLFFITASNDIFQYISGKLFGKTALAPNISRHKTYEGAIGGVVLTTLLSALIIPYILDVSVFIAATMGVMLGVLGIAGDLNMSLLKRWAQVKDSGTCLAGHGGLLDRIDSLLLSAPGFGLYLSLLSR